MNTGLFAGDLQEYESPELHCIDTSLVLPSAGLSDGDIEGENTGLDKDMELDGDFD